MRGHANSHNLSLSLYLTHTHFIYKTQDNSSQLLSVISFQYDDMRASSKTPEVCLHVVGGCQNPHVVFLSCC